jgi:hypothetical protein
MALLPLDCALCGVVLNRATAHVLYAGAVLGGHDCASSPPGSAQQMAE